MLNFLVLVIIFVQLRCYDLYWQKKFPMENTYTNLRYFQTSDNDIILYGQTDYFSVLCIYEAIIMRLSPNGEVIWAYGYGSHGDKKWEFWDGMIETSDKGFVFGGRVLVNGNDYEVFAFKITSNGTYIWGNSVRNYKNMQLRCGWYELQNGNLATVIATHSPEYWMYVEVNGNTGVLEVCRNTQSDNRIMSHASRSPIDGSWFVSDTDYLGTGTDGTSLVKYGSDFGDIIWQYVDASLKSTLGVHVFKNGDLFVVLGDVTPAATIFMRITDESPPNTIWAKSIDNLDVIASFRKTSFNELADESVIFQLDVRISTTYYYNIFINVNGTTGKTIEVFQIKDSDPARTTVKQIRSDNTTNDHDYIEIYYQTHLKYPIVSRFSDLHKCVGTNIKTERISLLTITDFTPNFLHGSGDYNTTAFGGAFLSNLNGFTRSTLEDVDANGIYECYEHKTWCHGVTKINTTFVCSGHGSCVSENNCTCFDDYYPENDCTQFMCHKKLMNAADVCNYQNGTCSSVNNCTCHNGYYGMECFDYECHGYYFNDSRACNGHGKCVRPNQCICDPFYNSTVDCEWNCGDFNKDSSQVCSKNGKCEGYNNCTCNYGYRGEECEYWSCFGVFVDEVNPNRCSGHGSCTNLDTCVCQSGYGSYTLGGTCNQWYCNLYFRNDSEVCSGRGSCVAHHVCSCEDGYEGSLCESWRCQGKKNDDEQEVCSGRGKCKGPDTCKCNTGYNGDYCQVNTYYASVMAPVLGTSFILFGVFLTLGIISLIACICYCCITMCLCACAIVTCLSLTTMRQKVSLKRFSKLRNIDLLLQEQKADEDTSVAHLRIKSNLFSIDMKEIKLVKILGEGGSSSTVYLAKWNDKDVAFKSFRTRTVCSDQTAFDEFEKEVEILGSVSHPNILSFFGCCLNPPRVGIVMEFCEKGDLLHYIGTHREKNDDLPVSISEKIRICAEIISPMNYLHQRSIIHRDLKLENVLVNTALTCKLMDFGLSRIVDEMSKSAKTKKIGTSYYMAPELILSEGDYNEKVDVFAFSICMYCIFTEEFHPYGIETVGRAIEIRVATNPDLRPDISKIRESFPKSYDGDVEWLEELIIKTWSHNAENRPSFNEIGEVFQQNKIDSGLVEVKDDYRKKEEVVRREPLGMIKNEEMKDISYYKNRVVELEDELEVQKDMVLKYRKIVDGV